MRRYTVDLNIPGPEMLRYYRGSGQSVVASSREGKILRFPARWLRPYVGADGVHGTFLLQVDAANRLLRLDKVAA